MRKKNLLVFFLQPAEGNFDVAKKGFFPVARAPVEKDRESFMQGGALIMFSFYVRTLQNAPRVMISTYIPPVYERAVSERGSERFLYARTSAAAQVRNFYAQACSCNLAFGTFSN